MSEINQALGRSSTAAISFNDAQVRFLANQESGSVSMSGMRSKYYYSGTITIGAIEGKKGGVLGYGFAVSGFGSITGTIGPDPNNINVMYSSYPDGSSVVATNSYTTPFTSTARWKVGSAATNNNLLYYNDGFNLPYWNDTAPAFAFGSGDVGSTYTWQFSNT
jgi:hypothetical protein